MRLQDIGLAILVLVPALPALPTSTWAAWVAQDAGRAVNTVNAVNAVNTVDTRHALHTEPDPSEVADARDLELGKSRLAPQHMTPDPAELEAGASAHGYELYRCSLVMGVPAWHGVAINAELFDHAGRKIAHHSQGVWWGYDASVARVEVMSGQADENALVPAQTFHVVSHEGGGLLGRFSYITRTNTVGGAAPRTPCDTARLEDEVRVPYTAAYTFMPR